MQIPIPLRLPNKKLLEKVSSRFSSAQCRIEIPEAAYLPGDEVPVRVHVQFGRRARVEGGLIALRCVWSYEVETDDSTYIKENYRNCQEKTVSVGRHFEAGDRLTEEFTALIPVEAQPSAQGSTVQVRWEVYVQLAMSGVDLRHSRPLRVLSAPKRAEFPVRASGECPDYEIRIEADSNRACAGESFSGRVTVAARSDLTAKRVQVRLKAVERITSTMYSALSTETFDDIVLASDPELRAGETRTYPFVCRVPGNACPSVRTPHFAVTWVLEAKIERRLRRDAEAELPVDVRTAPAVPAR